MKRNLLIFLVSFFLLSSSGRGQQLKYFEPFDSLSSDCNFHPVGKINNKYLALKLFATELPKLLIFNDSGSQVAEQIISIPELKNTAFPRFLVSHDSWTIVFQHQDSNTIYLASALFNESGELLQLYPRVDSSRVDKLGNASFYNYSVSVDRKKIISYRMILGLKPDKILIDFITFSSDGKEAERGRHYIPFRTELQEITSMFHHTDGESYFAIFDKPNDTKLSVKTNVYRLTNTPGDLHVKQIDFKASKPVQIVFVSNTISNELIFASLYSDHNLAGIKGLLITKIDIERKSANASTTKIPFVKARKGEWNIGKGNVKLGYKESRGDLLAISKCAILGKSGELTILFQNTQRTTKGNFQQQINSNTTYPGRDNITPSQDFDLLRDHIRTVETAPNRQGGSIFVRNVGIAPVSNRDILGSAILSENYTYHAQDISNSWGSVSNSPNPTIHVEHVQLQLDKYLNPLGKGKLSLNIPVSMPFASGYIANERELVILNYIPSGDNSLTLELFDADNPPYRALLSNKSGYKPFYGETFGYGGGKEILTFFTTADDTKIGLAIVSW